jgi:hypothetical protein
VKKRHRKKGKEKKVNGIAIKERARHRKKEKKRIKRLYRGLRKQPKSKEAIISRITKATEVKRSDYIENYGNGQSQKK